MSSKPMVTAAQLAGIVRAKPGSKHLAQIHDLIPALNKTLLKYEIDTPLRIAHFLAQIAHESMGLRRTIEIWPRPNLDRNGVARNGNRFQLRYEKMKRNLGNYRPGDGYRFRGRGLIQLTGRYNYTAYGKALGRDLVSGNNMEAVGLLPLAIDVAGWFWTSRRVNLNALADGDHFIRIMRAINGGENGREDRRRYLIRAKRVLGITGLQAGGKKTYTVRPGDFLSRIAATYGISLKKLKAANPEIKGPDFIIEPGQKIKIPGK